VLSMASIGIRYVDWSIRPRIPMSLTLDKCLPPERQELCLRVARCYKHSEIWIRCALKRLPSPDCPGHESGVPLPIGTV
jgi:hypothetical protein